MTIDWKLLRLDQGEPARKPVECLLEWTGTVTVEGQRAGLVSGFYAHAADLSSGSAFWQLWDVDGRACEVFERIRDEKWLCLREPLPTLMLTAPALICVEELALFPEFRRRSLGLEVMRRVVADLADLRVGAVILKSDPLQFTPEEFWGAVDERVVPGLPTDDRPRSLEKLQYHFRSWGMQLLPKTSYMVAAPDRFNEERAESWPPCTIQDSSNSCVWCDGLIDFKSEEWERTKGGIGHKRCPGE